MIRREVSSNQGETNRQCHRLQRQWRRTVIAYDKRLRGCFVDQDGAKVNHRNGIGYIVDSPFDRDLWTGDTIDAHRIRNHTSCVGTADLDNQLPGSIHLVQSQTLPSKASGVKAVRRQPLVESHGLGTRDTTRDQVGYVIGAIGIGCPGRCHLINAVRH